jgi:hypothetical protein
LYVPFFSLWETEFFVGFPDKYGGISAFLFRFAGIVLKKANSQGFGNIFDCPLFLKFSFNAKKKEIVAFIYDSIITSMEESNAAI